MTGKNKLISIGDLTMQLKQAGMDEGGFPVMYESDLSGASALVSGCVGALGGRSLCLGKVGRDLFGEQIINMLKSLNVDTNQIEQVQLKNTALTILNNDNGNQAVSYRRGSANSLLKMDDISPTLFEKGDVLFYSSDCMIDHSSRSAVEKAIKLAGQQGALIMYAPLIQNEYWLNDKIARETMLHTIPHTHIMIVTQEEMAFLTEHKEEHLAIKKLFSGKMKSLIILKPANRLTYVTVHDKGRLTFRNEVITDPSAVKEIFIGSIISKWLNEGYDNESISTLMADPDLLEMQLLTFLEEAYRAGEIKGAYPSLKNLIRTQ